ncbi:transmembrane protein, putative [Medicago truncatula]|uniref:Transmembrane protein, putative n=1 Tax=Medicago truncatula TaxID=3880 RepID=G7JY61_MEDTR|nr:transmembrane protein, putative [Medicago truncatula]
MPHSMRLAYEHGQGVLVAWFLSFFSGKPLKASGRRQGSSIATSRQWIFILFFFSLGVNKDFLMHHNRTHGPCWLFLFDFVPSYVTVPWTPVMISPSKPMSSWAPALIGTLVINIFMKIIIKVSKLNDKKT